MKTSFSIVTLHKAKNYGAALQAYALKTFLQNEGYDASIYDSNIIKAPQPYTLHTVLVIIFEKIVNLIFRNSLNKKRAKFDNFATRYFDTNKNSDSDVYIAGSDQVWNPIVYNPDYFLEFVNTNAVKASYAASLGVYNIPAEKQKYYFDALSEFAGISVRERNAKDVLGKILGSNKDIRVDLDPVFLLDKAEWANVAKASTIKICGKYIVLYVLHIPKNINKLCQWLKKETGYKLVLIDSTGYTGALIKHDIVLRNVGPEDFVNLIINSEAVITTSFHGTAFSILLEKEFYSVVNPDFSSRVLNLLNWSNMPAITEEQQSFIRHKMIFDKAKENIEKNRKESREYFLFLSEESHKNEK